MENKLKEILLIDDSRGTNILNKRKLIEMNVVENISMALNGEEAINYLKTPRRDNTYPTPEVVFLDLNMPVMDGYQFLQEVEQLDEKMKPGRIIMLTTSIHEADFENTGKHSLVTGYMLKPLTKDSINQLQMDIFKAQK